MTNMQNRTGWITWVLATAVVSLSGCSSKDSNNNANAGGQSGVCQQGETRECVGPAACKGAQACQLDLTWTNCDCGNGTGGSGNGGASNSTSAGGATQNNTGGNTSGGGAQPTGGAGNGTGGVVNPGTGGNPTTSTGGSATTGGAPVGTGGSSVTTTGGASSSAGGNGTTGGVAPTGGTSAVAGGTTSGAGGSTSVSPYISETDGRATDPAHSISGAIYTFSDSGGTRISPDCSTSGTCFGSTGPTTTFRAYGTAARVLDSSGGDCHLSTDTCDWTTYWGGALAIAPNQAANSTSPPSAWDGSAYTGLTFSIVIDAMPTNLRLFVNLTDGTQYCAAVTTSKTYTFLWGDLYTNCWSTADTKLAGTALTKIKEITWQVGTNASESMPFDFTISNVKINP